MLDSKLFCDLWRHLQGFTLLAKLDDLRLAAAERAAARQSFGFVVAGEGFVRFLGRLIVLKFKEVGWNGIICTALVVSPEANEVCQLGLENVDLLLGKHVARSTQVLRRTLELVRCLSLETSLSDLRDALLYNRASNGRHVEKEAEEAFEGRPRIHLEVFVAHPVGWDLCGNLI